MSCGATGGVVLTKNWVVVSPSISARGFGRRLARLRLTIHEAPAHPRPVSEGIPFLGFVVYPKHRRLKRRNVVNYRRRLKGLMASRRTGGVDADRLQASIVGWVNHARHGDTWGLRKDVLASVVL